MLIQLNSQTKPVTTWQITLR